MALSFERTFEGEEDIEGQIPVSPEEAGLHIHSNL